MVWEGFRIAAQIGQRIPRRLVFTAAVFLSSVAGIVCAPDAVHNLLMLAWVRNWTRPGDAGLVNLKAAAHWILTIKRYDPLLQAQSAGIAYDLDLNDEAVDALEHARKLASIARQCSSADAMLLEHMARPLLPRQNRPRSSGFMSFSTSDPAVSQVRTIAAEDGAANCVYQLTIAALADSADYGAMHAALPVQPGRRYRLGTECYAVGSMRADFRLIGANTQSLVIGTRDAWIPLVLNFQSSTESIVYAQIIVRSGAGRIVCRDILVSDITDDSRREPPIHARTP